MFHVKKGRPRFREARDWVKKTRRGFGGSEGMVVYVYVLGTPRLPPPDGRQNTPYDYYGWWLYGYVCGSVCTYVALYVRMWLCMYVCGSVWVRVRSWCLVVSPPPLLLLNK